MVRGIVLGVLVVGEGKGGGEGGYVRLGVKESMARRLLSLGSWRL